MAKHSRANCTVTKGKSVRCNRSPGRYGTFLLALLIVGVVVFAALSGGADRDEDIAEVEDLLAQGDISFFE